MTHIHKTSRDHRRRIEQDADRYINKILSYSPIIYWPLNEKRGQTAISRISSAQNRSYNRDLGLMSLGDGIGDGHTAPLFNGTDDHVDTQNAAIDAAVMNVVDEGSILIWFKVFNAGVWTDGIERTMYYFNDGNDDTLWSKKRSANNSYSVGREGGASTKAENLGSPGTGWTASLHTWSVSGDESKYYRNGVKVGATDTGLLAWTAAAPLHGTRTNIGLYDSANAYPLNDPWSGWLAHLAVFASVLDADAALDLATVP